MTVSLYDAAGKTCWITVTEEHSTRTLLLDGCEEGAMNLQSEEPVFAYLWFHKCSHLAGSPIKKALVLGAGAFTAAKCLALDHPQADIDVVDLEPDLLEVARQFFRMDRPEFSRIYFHGMPAENFLRAALPSSYDFIFDDLFDGFQHVPDEALSADHLQQLHSSIAPSGICVKNMIWDPHSASNRAACENLSKQWDEILPNHLILGMGKLDRGHNFLLIGSKQKVDLSWSAVRAGLRVAGIPTSVLDTLHLSNEVRS
jgi:spermidine synthase